MKGLIIIDMQEEYVGKKRDKKKYAYDSEQLTKSINTKILEYKQCDDMVIYIQNKGKSAQISALAEDLDVVSDLCFVKERASCFSCRELMTYLMDHKPSQLELAGVDGNYCVGMSAVDGIEKGFNIHVSLSCVGVGNDRKFQATKDRMLKAGVHIYE